MTTTTRRSRFTARMMSVLLAALITSAAAQGNGNATFDITQDDRFAITVNRINTGDAATVQLSQFGSAGEPNAFDSAFTSVVGTNTVTVRLRWITNRTVVRATTEDHYFAPAGIMAHIEPIASGTASAASSAAALNERLRITFVPTGEDCTGAASQVTLANAGDFGHDNVDDFWNALRVRSVGGIVASAAVVAGVNSGPGTAVNVVGPARAIHLADMTYDDVSEAIAGQNPIRGAACGATVQDPAADTGQLFTGTIDLGTVNAEGNFEAGPVLLPAGTYRARVTFALVDKTAWTGNNGEATVAAP